MIELLAKAEDRVKLHFMEDDSEEVTGIDRDQWVQWLVSQSMNGDMKIWANVNGEDQVTSYIVAYNCVDKPVADHIYVLYFWMDKDRGVNEELFERVKSWAKSMGAKTLQSSTVEPEDFLGYGFSASPETIVEMEV